MEGYLNQQQIEYVMFHLGHSVDLNEAITERFIFLNDRAEISSYTSKIIFLLSDRPFDLDEVKWIDRIPILFPLSQRPIYFEYIDRNLVFTDDMLKSAFFLLSGCQEYEATNHDRFGRFPFEQSVQHKLNIVDIPVVNYYFDWIISNIENFCITEHIQCTKKRLFENFGFLLTHDIDRVDAYDYYRVGYLLKQVLGIVPSDYDRTTTMKVFIVSLYHFLNIFSRRNPFWTFDFLRRIERDNNFRSIFYVLKNEGMLDSHYSIFEPRILALLNQLTAEQCEIGVHGTMNSALHYDSMNTALSELRQVTSEDIVGCRQHFLRFFHPKTMLIQEQCGLQYDTTLSFAEHEGFRHSYCLPFKIYYFAEDRMIDVWEFPLNVMEVTLFGYRHLSFEEAEKSVKNVIREIKKFHGTFTLLWHNCQFDENQYKGITHFYESLLSTIKNENPRSITGKELLSLLRAYV